MALHFYDRFIKCHDTQTYMSEILSMSCHFDDNMLGNFFDVYVNVSIDTKLYTCEIRKYDIKHFSGTCHIARSQRASVVR